MSTGMLIYDRILSPSILTMFRVICVSCKKLRLQVYTLTETLDRIAYKDQEVEPMSEEERFVKWINNLV